MKQDEALKGMADGLHDMIVVMQAAFIEWKHGKGADAAMTWIGNTLDNIGGIPDSEKPYAKEAQAWLDANCSHLMPACSVCGRPSNRCGGGVAACCEDHFQQAKNAKSELGE